VALPTIVFTVKFIVILKMKTNMFFLLFVPLIFCPKINKMRERNGRRKIRKVK
jgi:hypothetical protein